MIEYKIKVREFNTPGKGISININEYLDDMIKKGYQYVDIKYSACQDKDKEIWSNALVIMKGAKDE